jgi:hypothetical protein
LQREPEHDQAGYSIGGNTRMSAQSGSSVIIARFSPLIVSPMVRSARPPDSHRDGDGVVSRGAEQLGLLRGTENGWWGS